MFITDTPQVLSQSTLAILDPLNKNDDQTNVERQLDNVAPLINRFALKLFQPTITPTSTFPGTVVRLPLRRRPSRLSTQILSAPDIRQLLVDFIHDELRITLLFLTHLTSISVYEVSADGNVTRLAASSITRAPPTILDNLPLSTCTAFSVDLKETTTIAGTTSPLTGHWRILRTSFSAAATAAVLSTRLGFDATVDAVAILAEHKLQPDLAIAACLSPLPEPEPNAGRLFSFLPLPLHTHFSVHIHAPFALTPSREKLQNREETPARGSVYHISVEWNKLLFDTYLPQAWALLLHMLTASGIPDIFTVWPPRQSPTQLGDSGYWAALPTHLAETVVASRCCVWPVFASPKKFSILDDVLVATSEPDTLINALATCGLAITHPPQYIVELLKSATVLTPAAAHTSLLVSLTC
ncbi:hypothetical protein C0992_007151 [Termitomyces sp. T32_za158]|nr:hypothetical protein C0992_007151 [Termitomyces sp. T32_za158]